MHRFGSCSDDFYINLNLNTETELGTSRESVLHYFELMQRKYPSMHNFYCRDSGDAVLEGDKEAGHYRSGYVNPENIEGAFDQHAYVLELAPHLLSVSPLDCESLNLMFGFDFTFAGNHNQLIAEALGLPPAFEGVLDRPDTTAITYEPAIQFALADDCRLQCRMSIEPRTRAYHIRTGEFPSDEQLSVYITARRFGSLRGETYGDVLNTLTKHCTQIVDEYVMEQILLPLQTAIAMH